MAFEQCSRFRAGGVLHACRNSEWGSHARIKTLPIVNTQTLQGG